jgi:hypothetical protein
MSILELPNNKSEYIFLRSKKKSSSRRLEGSEISITTSLNPSEAKIFRRVYQAIHTHCPSLKQFPDFKVEIFMQSFGALLASHELIYFEVILTILGKSRLSKQIIIRLRLKDFFVFNTIMFLFLSVQSIIIIIFCLFHCS